MDNPLQTRPEWFIRRLVETAAWCLRGKLLTDVPESEEIQKRRALGEKAIELIRKSFLQDREQSSKSSLYAEAMRLLSEARLHEITPLNYQLRSPALKPDELTSRLDSRQWSSLVDRLAEKRVLALRSENCYPKDFEKKVGGRLLIYFPDKFKDNWLSDIT